jgi:hypothetical protein
MQRIPSADAATRPAGQENTRLRFTNIRRISNANACELYKEANGSVSVHCTR